MTQKVLFHGSRNEIKGFMEPRKATDRSHEDNSQNAVYATDRFECAKGMSLTGEQWAYADYTEKNFKVIFVKEPPTPKRARFVYELPAEYFEKTAFSHQFISKQKVPILKTHIFSTEQLDKYWRMATEKEREDMIKKHTNDN